MGNNASEEISRDKRLIKTCTKLSLEKGKDGI